MSSQRTVPVRRPAPIACCVIALVAVLLLSFARHAQASYYKMVICGAGVNTAGARTATNTARPENPDGIFTFQTTCDALGYPAGERSFMRIADNQEGGTAGYQAYGRFYWEAPGGVTIAAVDGYSREPNGLDPGWRGRFWVESYNGSGINVLTQRSDAEDGSCEGGVCEGITASFVSHAWPFPSYGSYRRFTVEMTCMDQGGCALANLNALDANSFQLVVNDPSPPGAWFSEEPLAEGQWVSGAQPVTWNADDFGSGLRYEWLRIDGAEKAFRNHTPDCDLGTNAATGQFARVFQPCPRNVATSETSIDTAILSDGAHSMEVCAQDYAESVGLNGTGGEECDRRTIRIDNTAPAAPSGLAIVTSNPNRYVGHFGARWTLPPDATSPIAMVHYEIVDAGGNPVGSEKTLSAVEPNEVKEIEGPAAPGDYRLRVWLEDSVGLAGPVASVAIPHDTEPPKPPQELSVTPPDVTRTADGFDVHWRNITDSGSPVDSVHYEVLDGGGKTVVPHQEVKGENPQAIDHLLTPTGAGAYTVRLWLSDAEGNVGAAVTAPLAYSCPRSDVSGGKALTAELGGTANSTLTVSQGRGSTLGGELRGAGDPIGNAVLCLFARITTEKGRQFLGTAITGRLGEYAFPVPAGASRELIAIYRGDHREVEAHALLQTQVKPVFKVRKRIVHNKQKACFYGQIPGPHNDRVEVVFQVKRGKKWRTAYHDRTQPNGHYDVCYRLKRTRALTVYVMRAQVRGQIGYPFEQGNSSAVRLKVMP